MREKMDIEGGKAYPSALRALPYPRGAGPCGQGQAAEALTAYH